MRKLTIQTFATWINSVSIFGTHNTPLKLLIRVRNNTNTRITINELCICVKNNFLIFSKDVLHQRNNYVINPNASFDFELDVRYISTNFSNDKKFTVKVTDTHGEIYESEKVSIAVLRALA